MIKVCHMTSVHDSRNTRIFHKMCASLAKAGYDVILVAPGESFSDKGVRVVGVGEQPSSRLKRMTQTARRVYEAALKIDAELYHFHDPELFSYALKLKKRGKTVIYDCHEDYVEDIMKTKEWIPRPFRGLISRLFVAYQTRVCQRMDAVIGVTPRQCESLRKANSNTVLVTNFPVVQENALSCTPDFYGKTIGFPGLISVQWNHALTIQAVERVEGARYLLCGQVSETYLSALKALPEWDRVDYLGRIPHEEVPGVLARCCVGMALLTSYLPYGSLGVNKFFEYMLAGLPVICTDSILWKEIVEKHNCGICVDPNDLEQIAAAIAHILNHPEEARQMGENGRKAVLEEYNWSTQEKTLLNLYNALGKH